MKVLLDQNLNYFNCVYWNYCLTSIFFVSPCLWILYGFFYLVLNVATRVCKSPAIERCRSFVLNRINEVPHIVLLQHHASTKAYESIKSMSGKRGKLLVPFPGNHIINPLHDNEDIKKVEPNGLNHLHPTDSEIKSTNIYPQYNDDEL